MQGRERSYSPRRNVPHVEVWIGGYLHVRSDGYSALLIYLPATRDIKNRVQRIVIYKIYLFALNSHGNRVVEILPIVENEDSLNQTVGSRSIESFDKELQLVGAALQST
jgi:hypothetical protein